MRRQMEMGGEVDFIADVGAGPAGGVAAKDRAAGVVQGVPGAVEVEDVVLYGAGDPPRRKEGQLRTDVVDVLTANQVEVAEIGVAPGKELLARRENRFKASWRNRPRCA